MTIGTPLRSDDVDLSTYDFWSNSIQEYEETFTLLRGEAHPRFFAEPDLGVFEPGPGFHAIVKHADIVEMSRLPEVFCSGRGATNVVDLPEEFLEFFGSMISMDDPRHARLRRIVARSFTPRMIRKFEADVDAAAARIVDDLIEKGSGCDFVAEVAAPLPLKIICDMMGIPQRDYQMVFDNTNVILGGGDPEFYGPESVDDPMVVANELLRAGQELQDLVCDLGRQRVEEPTDDLVSALVNANIDGERLTEKELGQFFILLVVAGNETTRNAIAHGLTLLTDNPVQKATLTADIDTHMPGAVEEIVRLASPVAWMRRSLTRDYELHGHRYGEGDKVLLYYWSANRDEAVFTDPYAFDITRDPNPHVGFGGPGPHFCLGAHLARREIKVMLGELLRRLPDIHAVGEPERLRSTFINGVKRLPCAFTP